MNVPDMACHGQHIYPKDHSYQHTYSDQETGISMISSGWNENAEFMTPATTGNDIIPIVIQPENYNFDSKEGIELHELKVRNEEHNGNGIRQVQEYDGAHDGIIEIKSELTKEEIAEFESELPHKHLEFVQSVGGPSGPSQMHSFYSHGFPTHYGSPETRLMPVDLGGNTINVAVESFVSDAPPSKELQVNYDSDSSGDSDVIDVQVGKGNYDIAGLQDSDDSDVILTDVCVENDAVANSYAGNAGPCPKVSTGSYPLSDSSVFSSISKHSILQLNKGTDESQKRKKTRSEKSGSKDKRKSKIKLDKSPKSPKKYRCKECAYHFLQHASYLEHKKYHSPKRHLECQICRFRFMKMTFLKQHMQVHYRHVFFPCCLCGRVYQTEKKLLSHLKKHADFPCNICGMAFKKHRLKSHFKEHNFKGTRRSTTVTCTVCHENMDLNVIKTHVETRHGVCGAGK